ncbi:MAG TPA: hypothetical protein VH253_20825 [Phycisphaerae bacterium]|nr:hypothetical protein [Phycisphaerae bacterium]
MISKTRRSFWEHFDRLPAAIQGVAREKFELWHEDPFHPSLQFKELRPMLWSARITDNYRALALRKGEVVVWFWVGGHAEYDRLIR